MDPLVKSIYDVLKAVRLLKQRHPVAAPVGVLAAIRRREPAGACHMKELAAEHALDPSTISRSVAALVRAGLVDRTPDPDDGRATQLHLTAAGHQAIDEAHAFYQERISHALRDWSPEEIDALTASMSRLAHDLIAQETVLEATR
ncbi:MarR family transcriptional regulator [Actinoplanes sp. NPDC049802]|uniref:MarR family winged helix-turn-helix transcriptional regulator n=1 Tax=Actinoplanes sp. NPDC049802 TaxID=3154742 RepID=UPI0033E19C46